MAGHLIRPCGPPSPQGEGNMPHAVEAGKRYVPEMVGSTPTGGTMRKVPRSESKRTTKAASLHWQPGKTGKCAAAQTLLALRKDGVRMGSTQRCFANGPSSAAVV